MFAKTHTITAHETGTGRLLFTRHCRGVVEFKCQLVMALRLYQKHVVTAKRLGVPATREAADLSDVVSGPFCAIREAA